MVQTLPAVPPVRVKCPSCGREFCYTAFCEKCAPPDERCRFSLSRNRIYSSQRWNGVELGLPTATGGRF